MHTWMNDVGWNLPKLETSSIQTDKKQEEGKYKLIHPLK